MKPNSKSLPALADIEREVVAESREWGRQRLEERLQKLAEEHGEVCPEGWSKGKAGMNASTEGVAKYLASHAKEL